MALQPGIRLGRYQILAPLGAGGMGEVYRARDPRLQRDVAIKVLPDRLSKDPQALSRFERESQAVAALSHPNILPIYDVGSDEGVTYAVSELLEGETLRNRLKRGALHWRKAVEIGSCIAKGLSASHLKGIIHRDLKPENIFLTTDSQVKILDFGLARWRPSPAPEGETALLTATEPGTVLGTVGYMSPEQVRGGTADAPSDIFSLGCVLYEMVSGRRAFSRETAVQTMTAILENDPTPLSETAPDIPLELEHTIFRCLEKDTARRSQSARDLSLALDDLLASPELLRPVAPSFRASFKIALAASLCVFLAIGFYWFGRSGKTTESIAVLPFVNASGNPDMDYLGDGITESLINSLSQVPNLAVMSRNAVFRYKDGTGDAQLAGKALKVQAVLTGSVVRRGDTLAISAELIDVATNRHLWGEHYKRTVLDIFTVEEGIATEIAARLRPQLTGEEKKRLTKRYTDNTEAYQLYLQGRYYWNKKTPAGFNKGIEYFEKAIQADPNYAPAYSALANLYYNLANYNFALMPPREAWAKAKAAVEKALQIDSTLAAAHASAALIAYQWEWDWPTAEREFHRALDLDRGSASTYEPSPSSTNHWYSHYLMSMGRTQDAVRVGRRALELDPVDLGINAHQGWYYLWTHEPERAIQPLRKTIEMDPNFSVAQWYLGLAYEQQGEIPSAVAQFQNCVRLTQERPAMLALLGHGYAAANRKSDTGAILQQLEAVSAHKYVPSYPVATIYAALGEYDQALNRLEKAYEERDAWMVYIKIDPRLDGLRSAPRFSSLLRAMNLQP